MKHKSINRLEDFEFHDAEVEHAVLDNNILCCTVSYLNVHKHTEHNLSDTDMEIRKALLTFYGVRVDTFEPSRTWGKDANGNSYTDEPKIIYTGAEAEEHFRTELSEEIMIYNLVSEAGERKPMCYIEATGRDPFFTVGIAYDTVTVAWEEYRRKAWYEMVHRYDDKLCLDTPFGDVFVPINVICQESDDDETTVFVGISYEHKEYHGTGKGCWQEAFAAIARQLPDDVFIKCCLTCRHGNLCPVGNAENELFCTKGVDVKQKSDLFFYTEDNAEREKRSRNCTYVCEDYKEQSEEFYTYNDYLYYLNKSIC